MDTQTRLEKILSYGLTQSEVAKELNCSQAAISDMKNGKSGVIRTTEKMATGLERLYKKLQRKSLRI
jgi:transcriptional regulator with XRE-family HTH domain